MAHRNLSKRLITASTILLFVAGMAGLAVLYFSAPAPDDVEITGTRHSSEARDGRAGKSRSSSGDANRQKRQLARAETIPPETASPTSTGDSASGVGTNSPPSSEGSTGGDGDGTPGATTTCPLPAYPSASCTGVPAGTNLRLHSGDLSIDTANAVIDGQDIRGCVSVNAPGVVIRRSKIFCSGSAVRSFADEYSGTGVVLEDVEISCGNTNGATGVGDYNATVRRANIHSCENGFDIDGRFTVENSYIHDLIRDDPTADPHSDGAQITVANGVAILHNTIQAGDGTSAIISPKMSDGVVSNVLIKDNLMAGGAYTLYCQQGGPGNNYRVVNNHFSTLQYPKIGAFGPWTDCEDEVQVTGNVYHETGLPVPL
jgi:hypothetical protein